MFASSQSLVSCTLSERRNVSLNTLSSHDHGSHHDLESLAWSPENGVLCLAGACSANTAGSGRPQSACVQVVSPLRRHEDPLAASIEEAVRRVAPGTTAGGPCSSRVQVGSHDFPGNVDASAKNGTTGERQPLQLRPSKERRGSCSSSPSSGDDGEATSSTSEESSDDAFVLDTLFGNGNEDDGEEDDDEDPGRHRKDENENEQRQEKLEEVRSTTGTADDGGGDACVSKYNAGGGGGNKHVAEPSVDMESRTPAATSEGSADDLQPQEAKARIKARGKRALARRPSWPDETLGYGKLGIGGPGPQKKTHFARAHGTTVSAAAKPGSSATGTRPHGSTKRSRSFRLLCCGSLLSVVVFTGGFSYLWDVVFYRRGYMYRRMGARVVDVAYRRPTRAREQMTIKSRIDLVRSRHEQLKRSFQMAAQRADYERDRKENVWGLGDRVGGWLQKNILPRIAGWIVRKDGEQVQNGAPGGGGNGGSTGGDAASSAVPGPAAGPSPTGARLAGAAALNRHPSGPASARGGSAAHSPAAGSSSSRPALFIGGGQSHFANLPPRPVAVQPGGRPPAAPAREPGLPVVLERPPSFAEELSVIQRAAEQEHEVGMRGRRTSQLSLNPGPRLQNQNHGHSRGAAKPDPLFPPLGTPSASPTESEDDGAVFFDVADGSTEVIQKPTTDEERRKKEAGRVAMNARGRTGS